ncbi:NudC domain-containing protein [Phanerochaete sordida]|uniref:NudC domain-containing protein 1 n=1 Tax=Phanerochaete sordida TaxID=48140 RepID=A0A9P3GLW2_9APHY|nr:NudC domain-containing protein [Phanerochaete sordida]
MPSFEPERSLLNPRFEGYKLDAIDQDAVVTRFSLPYTLNQSSPAGKTPLSFQEVQSRIRHNHLVVGPDGNVVYVDHQLRVVAVDVGTEPSFRVLCELPIPIKGTSGDGPHSEYPSAAFLDASTLLVSDGQGTLYALQLAQSGPANVLNAFELQIPEDYKSMYNSVPFRIHSAVRSASGTALAVLSSKHYSNVVQDESERKRQPKPSKYDIWGVEVYLRHIPRDQPLSLEIAWHRRGDDVPVQALFIEATDAFMFVGKGEYRKISSPSAPTYEPSQDEIAPIPRAGENLDSTNGTPTVQGPPMPPPYSWTQSEDSVTVAFPVPSATPKDAIKVTFSPTTLSLFVTDEDDVLSKISPVPLPRYALAKLWDGIRTTTSFWTLDRQAESAYGLLTLHLDKAHDGTRWAHVFAGAGTPGGAPEVPESLDASELAAIRDSLEKYTAALQGGDDASGLGLGRGMPSLAQGEADDEVDTDVGDMSVLTWVSLDGGEPAWAQNAGAGEPVTLLATPVPGDAASRLSVVVKHGIDGCEFAFDAAAQAWKHNVTYNALSFVLASKRDTRFVHHLSSKAVLAFESGSRDLGGNVYIYQAPAKRGDKFSKQAVLKVGDGASGPLLGVGAVVTAAGREEILCLCERELVMIHSTL